MFSTRAEADHAVGITHGGCEERRRDLKGSDVRATGNDMLLI